MRITNVRVRQVTGTMATEGPFWEERLVRPIDIYPEYRREQPPWGGQQLDERRFRLVQHFVQIETDEGVTGLAGPVWPDVARLCLTQLAPIILGKDPLATELLWDQMHRLQVHGRQGDAMMAISAIDCALWDLKGKALGQPIWRLLGGPTRTEVPAYASMLGFAVEDLGLVRERAQQYKDDGLHGPEVVLPPRADERPRGHEEERRAGPHAARDARRRLRHHARLLAEHEPRLRGRALCSRIEEYRPRWLEEPFMPDRIDSHVRLKAKTRIPLSGAEHEYTRWGFKRFIEKEALDVLQPDIYWCGGLSETLKIAAYATAHDLIVIPHGHSTPIGIHFSVAQSPIHTPYQEYLVKWNEINMHFLKPPAAAGEGRDPHPGGAGRRHGA